jgi:hypothetical protein
VVKNIEKLQNEKDRIGYLEVYLPVKSVIIFSLPSPLFPITFFAPLTPVPQYPYVFRSRMEHLGSAFGTVGRRQLT